MKRKSLISPYWFSLKPIFQINHSKQPHNQNFFRWKKYLQKNLDDEAFGQIFCQNFLKHNSGKFKNDSLADLTFRNFAKKLFSRKTANYYHRDSSLLITKNVIA